VLQVGLLPGGNVMEGTITRIFQGQRQTSMVRLTKGTAAVASPPANQSLTPWIVATGVGWAVRGYISCPVRPGQNPDPSCYLQCGQDPVVVLDSDHDRYYGEPELQKIVDATRQRLITNGKPCHRQSAVIRFRTDDGAWTAQATAANKWRAVVATPRPGMFVYEWSLKEADLMRDFLLGRNRYLNDPEKDPIPYSYGVMLAIERFGPNDARCVSHSAAYVQQVAKLKEWVLKYPFEILKRPSSDTFQDTIKSPVDVRAAGQSDMDVVLKRSKGCDANVKAIEAGLAKFIATRRLVEPGK
jgi:hypothetical protein